MIVTDDENVADMCRSLRNQGRAVGTAGAAGRSANVGSWLSHARLGYNFRMSEVNAALGVAQMRRLDDILKDRRRVADLYTRRLMATKDVILPTLLPETDMSWFVFVVRLAAGYTQTERDRVISGLRTHEIGSGDYFPCIHLQPFYRERFGFSPGMFPIAESVSQRTIALPFYNQLTEHDVELVCRTLETMIQRENLVRN